MCCWRKTFNASLRRAAQTFWSTSIFVCILIKYSYSTLVGRSYVALNGMTLKLDNRAQLPCKITQTRDVIIEH